MNRGSIFCVVMALCLWPHLSSAQGRVDVLTNENQSQLEGACASFPAQHIPPPEFPVIGVSFSGNLRMPIAEQNQIAGELKQLSYSEPLDSAGEELVERVRRAWRDRGFFKVDVNGNAVLTSRGADRGLALSVHINEGLQYRLGGILFQHNRVLTNLRRLRTLFPIQDGEVFSPSRVAEGLQNLRKAYGEFGYINYTGLPNTRFDDEHRRIYVEVNIDEGKQFYVDRVEVLGLDDARRLNLLRESALYPGSVYNRRLDDLFLERMKLFYPACGCADVEHTHLDERKGTVVLSYDLRSCTAGRGNQPPALN